MNARFRVIIDNDFSGDPDDLFQLAHHILSPSVDICGIIGSHLSPGDFLDPSDSTAKNAVKYANELLSVAGFQGKIPVVEGAPCALLEEFEPLPSPGSDLIIKEALREAPNRLFIACGAGLTDLASAVLLKPEIAERLTLIWIGGPEYPEIAPPPGSSAVEYNLRIDISAARYIFNESKVPIWQVPRDAYRQCLVSLSELEERVKPKGKLGEYLFSSLDRVFKAIKKEKWIDAETYILGDQPLVLLTALQSLFEPDTSSSVSVYRNAPKIGPQGQYEDGDGNRKIRVYTRIDNRLLFEDFYAKLGKRMREMENRECD